jgi:ATP-dependent Clp protease ATP-binding subunit ClpA
MTTNLGSKIIERESGIKPKSEQGEGGFKITPDAVIGWEPVPEPIKDPEIFERVTKLVNDELKNFFRPEFLNRIDEIVVFNHLTRIDIWEICDLMIKQVQKRLKEKGINLIVDLSVQAFLTDEGYDPIYGARPLRRAIMKYLEDTLAEQCLSKTLYPNTKIYVRRKKVEGTLMTYTNEIEVEVDFSDVDPTLLEQSKDSEQPVSVLLSSPTEDSKLNQLLPNDSELNKPNLKLGDDEPKPTIAGRAARFFRKKS